MNGTTTLDQLRVLIAISETGSFSAAGRALHKVQSAISQSVKKLEDAQGVAIFDRADQKLTLTPVGRVLIEQARLIVASADRFEAIAAATQTGMEPELTLAIDSLVPSQPLIQSLHSLRKKFPDLPVSFSTEVIGGAEQRLRAGSVALAICLLLPSIPEDFMAYPLIHLKLIPVVAAEHPLTHLRRTLERIDLEPYVQLVLSDAHGPGGRSHGVVGNRTWRFSDQTRRLDFLLSGFGWCKMPSYLVESYLKNGQLRKLKIADESLAPTGTLPIYAAHMRDQQLGQGASWLLDDLRKRLAKAE